MTQPQAEYTNRILRYVDMDPAELIANPLNARTHPVAQRAALRASLSQIGWLVPVMFNERTGRLVDGHARVEDAASAGVRSVPVAIVDLDPNEERLVLATFDPIGAMAGLDAGVFADLTAAIDFDVLGDVGPLAELIGSINAEIAAVSPPVALTDPDAIPDPPATPVTAAGDVWLLGPHRVMCGDATSAAAVRELMAGHQAMGMVTDPPYGVGYGDTVGFRRQIGKGQRPEDDSHIVNDGTAEARALWIEAFPLWVGVLRRKGSAVYCWSPPGPQQIDLGAALQTAGLSVHGSVVWVKSGFSFSRADHKYQHEPAWYAWRSDGTHQWCGPNNEPSVWEFPRPNASPLHPTQKPVDLFRRCIRNIVTPGHVVVDPFLGSGTTVVAAHLEGAVCYGMEISPQYVDIICKRWQDVTGELPRRGATEEPVDFSAQ